MVWETSKLHEESSGRLHKIFENIHKVVSRDLAEDSLGSLKQIYQYIPQVASTRFSRRFLRKPLINLQKNSPSRLHKVYQKIPLPEESLGSFHEIYKI